MLFDLFLTAICLAVYSADALGKDYGPSPPKQAFCLFITAFAELSTLNFCVGLCKFLFSLKLTNTRIKLQKHHFFSCAGVNLLDI